MRVACAILLLSVATVGFAAEDPLVCQWPNAPRNHPPVRDLTGALPAPDYIDIVVACTVNRRRAGAPPPARPSSAWLDTERRTYADALARTRADVLVVPFQIQSYGLDQVERGLMAADLAYAIGDAGSVTVADPFLVALALGEGMRQIDLQEAAQLADRMGARKLVVAYVGHDTHHAFTLSIQIHDASGTVGVPAKLNWQRDWRGVPFTDVKTPALVFHDMLPEVVKSLPLELGAKKADAAGPSQMPARITSSLLDTVTSASAQSSPAATFSLLGALAPPGEERVRRRLFERAFLASLRSNNTTPAARFLEVYSLMSLERRPFALERLGKLDSPAFGALRSLLNGDLPGAQRATAKVTDPFQRLLLQVELRDLEYVYHRKDLTKPSAAQNLFSGPGLAWTDLLTYRLDDRDIWSVGDPLTLMQSLDASFPSQGSGVNAVTKGSSVVRGEPADDIAIDIEIGRRERQTAARLDVPECCHSQQLRPTAWDLLWLMNSLSERRIDKMLQRLDEAQGQPEGAISALARYEPFFNGHPLLTADAAHAAWIIGANSPDDERATWNGRTLRDAAAALWWAQGQGELARRVLAALDTENSQFWLDGFGYDYPRQASWPFEFFGLQPLSGQKQAKEILFEALAFSRSNATPPLLLLQEAPQGRAALVQSLAGRFIGSGVELQLSPAGSRPVAGDPSYDPLKALRDLVKADPEKFLNHLALGTLIVESGGSYKDAQAAFLAYPKFQDGKTRDRVELSNEAFDAGSVLYLQGATELARPLYKIAADLNTGSDASMSSAIRLHMLAREYRAATQGSFERAVQYASPYAYRDYLSFLHAFGERDAAWAGFSRIESSFDLPQVWVSALVGHRMQGLDERAVRAWLKQPEIRDARFGLQKFASWYAVLWSSTDRLPPADLGALVEELEGPPVAFVDADGVTTFRPHPSGRGYESVDPTRLPNRKPAKFPFEMKLKSERAFFADAYAAVARGDYETAVSRFGDMVDHYALFGSDLEPSGVALPYFAYAAGKTGDKYGLESILKPESKQVPADFDMRLARAFFAASHNNVAEARKWLGLAFRARPNTDYRPILSEFQYAQACEWLYRDTHDEQFRTMLLDWVKKHQLIQPAQGWAYAMQYSHEKDPAERIRSLAMARYLDPSSERIRAASSSDVSQANAWLKAHNPFAKGSDPAKPVSNADIARAEESVATRRR
jgi:hypothetical protein